jgi:2-(1,2-epoxy-1,2-dihydrophenyl)acetyl-CoA isomerase
MAVAKVELQIHGPVARIALHAPERLNAIDAEMAAELRAAFARAEAEARAMLLTGTGRAFCSGADLTGSGSPSVMPADAPSFVKETLESHFNPVVQHLRTLSIPSVIAVNGIAAGGGIGLALSGDVVVASLDATFVPLFAPKLALVPDMGVSAYLAKIGRGRAIAAALLGDPIAADEAERLGLIYKAVPAEQLADTAAHLAERLAEGPTKTLVAARLLIDAVRTAGFEEQLQLETSAQEEAAAHPHFLEAVMAFAARRAPRFAADPESPR